jgi:hypothetical protein
MKRLVVATLVLPFVMSAPALAAADVPAAPAFDRVKYDRPDDYLVLSPSLGNADRIRAAAAPLKREKAEKTLVAIHKWVNAEPKYDARAASGVERKTAGDGTKVVLLYTRRRADDGDAGGRAQDRVGGCEWTRKQFANCAWRTRSSRSTSLW